jgi:hypothetical protein
MRVDRQAFKDADPLHEGTHALDEARARMRQSVLAAAAAVRPMGPTPGANRRLLWVAPAMLLVVLALAGTRMWMPGGVAPLQAAQVRLEVHLAEAVAARGLTPMSLSDGGRVVYLHRDVLVTNIDIAQTGVVEADGRFAVRVEFTRAGADRMRRATAAHVGRPLAILLDGRLALAPVLTSPIDREAVITGGHTRESAERLAAGLARR